MRSKKLVLASVSVLSVFLVTAGFVGLSTADSGGVYLLEMPEERIDYTICSVNGSLWAKVDGTYPLNKRSLEQGQSGIDENLFTLSGTSFAMCYPTPPSTRNITIKLDGIELSWSNYTTTSNAVHYTAIGNWPMIICEVSPVKDQFLMTIHYEHPIIQKDGDYVFLYDLNISPYLSHYSNRSTAHFNIRFETDVKDIKVSTVATNGTTKPVDYTTTEEPTQTITLEVTSKYSNPLPGDLLISFQENKETIPNTPQEQTQFIIAAIIAGTVLLTVYVLLKRNKRKRTASQQSYL